MKPSSSISRRSALLTFSATFGSALVIGPNALAASRTERDRKKKIVRQVQRALKSKGYNPGPIDGSMGDQSVKALARFQRKSGIPATGKITAQTLDRLLDKESDSWVPASSRTKRRR